MTRKKPAPHLDCGVETGFPRDKRAAPFAWRYDFSRTVGSNKDAADQGCRFTTMRHSFRREGRRPITNWRFLGAERAGGGRRTRTFEVIRRLIYSQLPLPLGTLPRSTPSRTLPPKWRQIAMDDVKTGRRWRAPGWPRLWGNRPGKVNQRPPLIRGPRG